MKGEKENKHANSNGESGDLAREELYVSKRRSCFGVICCKIL